MLYSLCKKPQAPILKFVLLDRRAYKISWVYVLLHLIEDKQKYTFR